MKKTFLFLIPIMALLIGCSELNFGHTSDEHSAGIEGSYRNSYYSQVNYTYFGGDDVETSDLSVASFTFNVADTQSNISSEDITPLINCDNSSVSFIINDALNVGTKEGVGLFIGADSTYVDGRLTVTLDKAIKAVIIKARRYYSFSNAWNTENVNVDSEVGVAINNSKYVKLTGEKDSSNVPNVTTCRYNLIENKNQIEIKVGPRRAFIEEIAFYY